MPGIARRTTAPACASVAYLGAAFLLLSASAACGRDRDPAHVRAVDLIFHFKDAERRPVGGVFEIREHTFGGRSRASLIIPAGSRMKWNLLVPRRARLHIYAGVPDDNGPAVAMLRVGISDGRHYETLVEQEVSSGATASGWVPVAADLSLYAGRKLSLFFRPESHPWQIIVGTHIVRGNPGFLVLGEPAIEADTDAARDYRQRLIDAANTR